MRVSNFQVLQQNNGPFSTSHVIRVAGGHTAMLLVRSRAPFHLTIILVPSLCMDHFSTDIVLRLASVLASVPRNHHPSEMMSLTLFTTYSVYAVLRLCSNQTMLSAISSEYIVGTCVGFHRFASAAILQVDLGWHRILSPGSFRKENELGNRASGQSW